MRCSTTHFHPPVAPYRGMTTRQITAERLPDTSVEKFSQGLQNHDVAYGSSGLSTFPFDADTECVSAREALG